MDKPIFQMLLNLIFKESGQLTVWQTQKEVWLLSRAGAKRQLTKVKDENAPAKAEDNHSCGKN